MNSTAMPIPKTLIVMGVSASGKTTVSRLLGLALDYRVLDADDLHPQANIDKMRQGIALTDADRAPWLRSVAAWIAEQRAQGVGVVVACSALKRAYRDMLRDGDAQAVFVWLDVARQQLDQRIAQRPGHFMPASLLGSQLDTLEPPAADERAVHVVPDAVVAHTVDDVLAKLKALH